MANTADVLQRVDITNEEFFSITKEKLAHFEDILFELERFDTILVKSPGHIDITKQCTFPVLYISQSDDIREWHVQEYRNLIVTAYNVSNGKLIAKTTRRDEKRRIYPPKDERRGPPPKDISTTSYGTGCEMINIRHSLDMSWQPSVYRITLICFDWVSNTVDVVLHDGDTRPLTNIILPQQSDRTVDAILSGAKNAGRGDVTFTVPQECDANPENIAVQGKFAIPVTAHNVVEFKDRKSVVIPAWVMLVEKNIDQGSALLGKWFITADLLEKNTKQAVAEGIFKFSFSELLPALADKPLASNDYCCYLVVNGYVFGPEKCSITD